MGKIIDLPKSRDGNIRHAIIKMPNDRITRRSLNHVYPLKIYDDDQENLF